MAKDQRVYSDDEFALVLRKATELATHAERPVRSSGGLTLAEMKSAAAQVGLDPALVERAAQMLIASSSASPLERLTGGPFRHHHEAHFPVTLDESGAATLLSAIRIRAGLAGYRDAGHSGAQGMTWHDGGELEALRITALTAEDGTTVSIAVDRRFMLMVVAMASGIVMMLAFLFAVFGLYPQVPALGYAGLIVGIGAPLAIARGYWVSSTRKLRDRISGVMDAIGQTLGQLGPAPSERSEVVAAPEASSVTP